MHGLLKRLQRFAATVLNHLTIIVSNAVIAGLRGWLRGGWVA